MRRDWHGGYGAGSRNSETRRDEKAEKKDITVMTENALDYKEQIQLLKEINMPNLTIHFDTQNFKFNFNMDQ